MPTAIVEHPEARIRLRSGRLLVTARRGGPGGGTATPEETLRALPLHDLERLVINERVQLTTQSLAALLGAGGSLVLTGMHGRFLGACLPSPRPTGATRLAQYRCASDPVSSLALARPLVVAKIANQRRLLQRLALTRGLDLGDALAALAGLRSAASRADTLDRLRGMEGAASARYFPAWARFLPEEFPFPRRSTRPPLDPVNACLSFGASLLYNEFVARLHARGLDPALGFLHVPTDDRWSLALDLIEPYRPCVVEALALQLFSHRVLRREHFSPAKGGVYLNPEGRRLYFLHYERRLTKELFSEHRRHRTTLRREIDAAVFDCRRALDDPAGYAPFVMN